MKKRKVILILLALLLAVFLLYLLFVSKKEKGIVAPLPAPKIPKLLKGAYPVEIAVEKKDFNFPSRAPLLELKRETLQEQKINDIASKLNFVDEPLRIDDVFDGKMYIYKNETSSLTVAIENQEFDYTLNNIPSFVNKQLSKDAFINLAADFLTQNNFVLPNEVQFSFITHLVRSSRQGLYPVAKEKATLHQVNFSPSILGVTILTLNPLETPIYVRILPDGTVLSAHVTLLGTATKSSNEYKLKNYEDVVASIDQATLISLDDGNLNLPDISNESIKKVVILEIQLAYLLDSPKSKVLQPVYLLKGEAIIAGFPSKVSAFLYLPATSSN